MSLCKTRKPELIAIYRLEFYKKQNNWKLSSRKERDKKVSAKSAGKKKNLNVTYDLDNPDSAERTDPLNVAFVDSYSEKTTQTKCLKVYSKQRNKELSQEWLWPVNISPNTETCEDPPKISTTEQERNVIWNSESYSNYGEVERINSKPKAKSCTQRRLEELQKAANSQGLAEEWPKNEDVIKDYCTKSLELKNTWVNSKLEAEWKADAGDMLDPGQLAQDNWTHDKTTQTKCLKVYSNQKNTELSQEWLWPVNIWPKTETCEGPPKTSTTEQERNAIWNSYSNYEGAERINSKPKPKSCTQRRLEELQKAANSQGLAEEWPKIEDDINDYCPESLEIKNTWVNSKVDSECKVERYPDLTAAGAMIDSGQIAQDVWTHAPVGDIAQAGMDYASVVNPEDCEQSGLVGDAHWISERSCSISVDSEGEFMRGAHVAPHSSEAELKPPEDLMDASFSSLSRLSWPQLVAAAHQHSRALHKLLLESDQRQKLRRASMNIFSRYSFDEYPTKDIGPFDLGNRDNSFINRNIFDNDVILACSHKNVCAEGRGRGRGRLNETSILR